MRPKCGHPLHPIGFGTWTFGDASPASLRTATEVTALRHAVRLGLNHIDTAEDYADGGAERVVGRAVNGLAREDLFIASKLWKHHLAKDAVRPAVEAMLGRLGTAYLDLLYIHHPWRNAPWREALPQIDALIDDGLVRYLGVSNFAVEQLQEALARARHPIAANQIRYSCAQRDAAGEDLVGFCRRSGVAIVAYRPLDEGNLVNDALLAEIAGRYGATSAQIALAWVVANDALPIPKALREEHIAENAAAADIRLSADDVARIDRAFGPAPGRGGPRISSRATS